MLRSIKKLLVVLVMGMSFCCSGCGKQPVELLTTEEPTPVADEMGDKVWKQITSSAEFSPRKGHKVLVFDNKLWLFGGANTDSQLLEDIWQSTDGKQWLEVKPATKLPTFNGMNNMVVFKDKIWLFAEGGEVWNTTDGIEWEHISDDAEYPDRYGKSIFEFQNKLWLIGGWNKTHFNDVWNSEDGISWKLIAENAGFAARSNYCTAVYNDKLWLMTGQNGLNLKDVWYTKDGLVWEEVTIEGGFEKRHVAQSAVCYDKLWLMAGFAGTPPNNTYLLGDVWYSSDGINWTEKKAEGAFGKRHQFQSAVINEKIYVIGGEGKSNNSGELLNDVWCLE